MSILRNLKTYRVGGLTTYIEKMYYFIQISLMKARIEQMPLQDEAVHFGKCAVFWGKYNETSFLKTSYHKYLIKESFYKSITIRNSRTFEKIADLLKK